MKPVRCLIVDDEPLARDILHTYIGKIPGWEVVGSCINAEEAFEALMRVKADVMFLDIQMPVISGTDFLRSLKNPPLVVFTTAYSQYAVEGFDLNIVDYLVKPVTLPRFYAAVEKVKEKLGQEEKQVSEKRKEEASYFFVKYNSKLLKIEFHDIDYVKAEKDFSSIYAKEKRLLVGMHLKMLEDVLPARSFTRVHRSYIVRHSQVSSISGNTIQIGEHEIPIGTHYKDELFRKLNIS